MRHRAAWFGKGRAGREGAVLQGVTGVEDERGLSRGLVDTETGGNLQGEFVSDLKRQRQDLSAAAIDRNRVEGEDSAATQVGGLNGNWVGRAVINETKRSRRGHRRFAAQRAEVEIRISSGEILPSIGVADESLVFDGELRFITGKFRRAEAEDGALIILDGLLDQQVERSAERIVTGSGERIAGEAKGAVGGNGSRIGGYAIQHRAKIATGVHPVIAGVAAEPSDAAIGEGGIQLVQIQGIGLGGTGIVLLVADG